MPGNWRSVVLRFVVGLVLTHPLFSWQNQSQSSDQKNIYKLTGNVINSVTEKPIPRVLVTLGGFPERAMLTGPQGDFSFDNLPQGWTQIHISKPGFFPSGKRPIDNFPVRVGPDADSVTIKLEPEAVITGNVMGKDEEPVEESFVDVLKWQVIDGRRQLASAHHGVMSDEDGNFRISGLAPGRYYLSVKAHAASRSILGMPAGGANETYPARIYFLAAEDIASAEPVDVAPGQHVDVRFTLKSVPSFKVSGVITNAGEWKQLNSPMIVDEFGQALFQPERFNNQSGAFEFRAVPAGSYWLQFGAVDQEGRYTGGHKKLAVQTNIADLRLSVPRQIEVPVTVRTEFTKTPGPRGECTHYSSSGEKQTSDCSDYPAVRLEMVSLDFANVRFYSDNGPLKGGLKVTGVSPGRYSVRVVPTFGGYVQSVRCGMLDLLREPLLVPESGSLSQIEVVLRDDSATLNIRVRTEKAGQQTLVLVFPDPITAEPRTQAMLQGGDLEAGSLPPGAYRIFAFDPADGFDYSDPDALAKYVSKGASVTVGASERASVIVDLIHTGE